MGRALSFERERAIAAATAVIWERGYGEASLAELVAETGLNRSSLYNTFGAKRDVLVAAINHYTSTQVEMLDSLLATRGLHEGLRALFDSIIDDNNEGRGCLLVNCAAELAPRNRPMSKRLRSALDALASVIAKHAASAQAARQLTHSVDCDVLAMSLIAGISGLRILAKAGMDRRTLKSAARQLLESLLSPRT